MGVRASGVNGSAPTTEDREREAEAAVLRHRAAAAGRQAAMQAKAGRSDNDQDGFPQLARPLQAPVGYVADVP